jgi:flagellar hook-associated protein 3 FlgL
MKVSNRFLYYQLVKDLSQNTEKMFRLNNQISSGKRIDTPSEDPIGMSSVLIYRTELNSFTQYKKSIDYANGWLNRMDSILQETDNILGRASELAVQQASATSTADTRSGAAEEVKELRSTILSQANAKYGNKYIFGGTMTQDLPFLLVDAEQLEEDVATMASAPPAAPADGDRYLDTDDDHIWQYDALSATWVDQGAPADGSAVIVEDQNTVYVYADGQWSSVYQGNESTFSMQIGKEATAKVNIPGSELFINPQGDVFMSLLRLERALRANDPDGISAQLGAIEDAGKILSDNLAKVGAIANKLDNTKSILETSRVDTTEMVSNIEDLDYAEAITSLQNQQTIYEAALKSASMITGLSLVDYI